MGEELEGAGTVGGQGKGAFDDGLVTCLVSGTEKLLERHAHSLFIKSVSRFEYDIQRVDGKDISQTRGTT